jgi:NitT/TauT family transport system substrate-binding protein
MPTRFAGRPQRLIALLGAAALLLAACAPAAPSPTAAPAKPAEATKPAAASPAASPAAASPSPAASPAAVASPAASPVAAAASPSPVAAAPVPGGAAAKPLAQPTRLTLGVPVSTPNNTQFPFYVAKELGFWTEDNLELEFVNIGGSGGTMQQLVAGRLDLAGPSMPAVLNTLGQGNQAKNIYTWSRGTVFYLSTLEDSGITRIEDLRGKNVGISEPGGGEVPFLRQAVALRGLDPDRDIRTIPIGEAGATAFDAVQSKRVDAYASNLAELLTMQSRGLRFRDLTPPEFLNYPVQSIIVTPESLARNRDALVVAGRGVAKATLFCQTNKDACNAIMRKQAPEHYTNEAVAMGTLDSHLDMAKVGPGNLYGAHSPEEMQEYIRLTLETNPRLQPFTAQDLLVDDLIPAMNQFDREAVIRRAREYR